GNDGTVLGVDGLAGVLTDVGAVLVDEVPLLAQRSVVAVREGLGRLVLVGHLAGGRAACAVGAIWCGHTALVPGGAGAEPLRVRGDPDDAAPRRNEKEHTMDATDRDTTDPTDTTDATDTT